MMTNTTAIRSAYECQGCDKIHAADVDTALAEVRRETWEAAIGIVNTRLALLEAQTATSSGLAQAACSGRDSAIREIVAALESAKEKDGQA